MDETMAKGAFLVCTWAVGKSKTVACNGARASCKATRAHFFHRRVPIVACGRHSRLEFSNPIAF